MSLGAERMDVVVSGSAEPDPRRRRMILVALAVALVLAAVAGFVDLRSRQGEYAALTRCVASTAEQVGDADRPVVAMSEYVRPALTFAGDAARPGLYALVAGTARSVLGGVQRARVTCAAVGVRGWHGGLRRARAAELAYLDAELDLLVRTAANGQKYFGDQSRITALAGSARTAVAAARPPLA